MLASVFRTVFVYVAVITAMRLMGKRQLGELQPAELVTTFLISNVASMSRICRWRPASCRFFCLQRWRF